MTDFTPIKAVFDTGDSVGLAEFQAADTIGIADGGTGAITASAARTNLGAIATLLEDATPQLAGDLDLNTNDITGTGNILITGTIQTSGETISNASYPTFQFAGYGGTANIYIDTAGANDLVLLNSGTNSGITFTPNGTGKVKIDNDAWPSTSGTNLQVLTTNGAGTLSWTTPAGGSTERTIITQTGTTYTLVLTDQGDIVTMSNAAANTLTIPTNASVAFATGTQIDVVMLGAGSTQILAGTGVTLNGITSGTTGGVINNQYAAVTLIKLATDTWVMMGDMTDVAA